MFAQAQSSAEVEYQDAPPTVPGHAGGSDANREPSAHKANSGGGGGGSGAAGGGSGKGGSSDKAGNGPGGEGGRQGSQGQHRDGGSDATGPGQGAQAAAIEPASEDDGGSSPLVPILIAIAVLAAISIGVVVIRQRRGQDASPGTPASPEAG